MGSTLVAPMPQPRQPEELPPMGAYAAQPLRNQIGNIQSGIKSMVSADLLYHSITFSEADLLAG